MGDSTQSESRNHRPALVAVAVVSVAVLAMSPGFTDAQTETDPVIPVCNAAASNYTPAFRYVAGALAQTTATVTPEAGDRPDRKFLPGDWKPLPRSPISANLAAAAVADGLLVVVDPDSGGTASYEPSTRQWHELDAAPHGFSPLSPSVWTGRELVILGSDEQDQPIGLSFDPAINSWSTVPAPPIDVARSAAWTGQQIIAASSDGSAATYDPGRGCWSAISQVPGGGTLVHLYAAGDEVLAVSELEDDLPLKLASFDVSTGDWTMLSQGPVTSLASEAIWTDGELIFIDPSGNDTKRIRSAAYAPQADSWRILDTDCKVSASTSVWTGGRIIDAFNRRAFDPVTGDCTVIRKSDEVDQSWMTGTRTWFTTAWTGEEVVMWSGSLGAGVPPSRDGVAFRPSANIVR